MVGGDADGVGEEDMGNAAVVRDGHVLGDIVVEKVLLLDSSLRNTLGGLDPIGDLPVCIYNAAFQQTLQPFDPLLLRLDAQLEAASSLSIRLTASWYASFPRAPRAFQPTFPTNPYCREH